MKLYTYEELAEMFSTKKETLYALSAQLLTPATTVKGIHYFDQPTVDRLTEWWEENSRFRADPNPPDEPAYTTEDLDKMEIKTSKIQYYRRRYGRLFPDFYVNNPKGRGRPIAMYLKSSIDEFQAWIDAERPEDPSTRIKDVQYNQGKYDVMVYFGDGTVLAKIGDDWRMSPPANDHALAQKYIKNAERWIKQLEYGQKWSKKNQAKS